MSIGLFSLLDACNTYEYMFVHVLDACNIYEYENIRYKPVNGSECQSFCQCAHLKTNIDGSVEYYWVKHNCPAGTLWDQAILTCDHASNVKCQGIPNYFAIFYNLI